MSMYDCKNHKMKAKIEKDIVLNCPYIAVIPSLTVDTPQELTGVQNSLVHITQNNTTVYIDDHFRTLLVFAGEVEYDNYDYENNPLNFKGQTVVDFANNRTIRYDKTGTRYIVTNGTGGGVNG